MSLDEIVHDHAEIERTASELRRLAAEGEVDLEALQKSVEAFRRAMHEHMGQEEAELFPKLREVAPDLVERIDNLEREHAEMRDTLDELVFASDKSVAKTSEVMEALWKDLDKHAGEEADILSVTRDDAFPGQISGD